MLGGKEERRKAGKEGGEEGLNASGTTGKKTEGPGASGSLSGGKARRSPRPVPRPKQSGKGLLGPGRSGKVGSFGTLKEWLLREEEASQKQPRAWEDPGGGQGRKEGIGGGKDRKAELP